MLAALLKTDITRLKKRDAYLDALMYFGSMEPEEDLRRAAVERLGELAPQEADVEKLLAENLEYELSEGVQAACLAGLKRCTKKSGRTIELLVAFGNRAPQSLRPGLLEIYGQLERDALEAGCLALLHPGETDELRGRLLDRLADLPVLSPAGAKGLTLHLGREPKLPLREKTAAILTDVRKAEAGIFRTVLDTLRQSPDSVGLIGVFKNRLASHPTLVKDLAGLFGTSGGSRLKRAILELLSEADVPELFAAALNDPSPWVRYAAIQGAEKRLARHPKEIAGALMESARSETVVELRKQIAGIFIRMRGKEKEHERFLLEWMVRETDPRIGELLAAAVAGTAITDENRDAVLQAFRKILLEPFADPKVKRAVMDRLRSFSYRNEPELVECLKDLMERAEDIESVEAFYERLRKLESDSKKTAELYLSLFYKFIQHYPRDPLPAWLEDFGALAEQDDVFKARIPWLVRLTGATWMLGAASAAEQKSAFLDVMNEALSGKGGYRAANNLLREAWKNRTLKKGDVAAVFRKLLATTEDGVLQDLLKIMSEGKLVTPEILDACFGSLKAYPGSRHRGQVLEFLSKTAKDDAGYRDRVFKAFTQKEYSNFCRTGMPKDAKAPPRTWNDWEYQWWRLAYDDWPVADLVDDLGPSDEVIAHLSSPPDESVACRQSVHYLILEHWWRHPSKDWSGFMKRTADHAQAELRALAALLKNTAGRPALEPLRDRAVCLFWKRWETYIEKLRKEKPAEDLTRVAAEVYVELYRRHAVLGKEEKERFPKPLKGMDPSHLKSIWPDSDTWDEFAEKHVTASS